MNFSKQKTENNGDWGLGIGEFQIKLNLINLIKI